LDHPEKKGIDPKHLKHAQERLDTARHEAHSWRFFDGCGH